MVKDRRAKQEARQVAQELGVSYTKALRIVEERKAASDAVQDPNTDARPGTTDRSADPESPDRS